MEISNPTDLMGMESAKIAQSKEIAVLKKGIDLEKDMAEQLIDAIPKVDHSAPRGQQVRLFA